MEHPHVQVEFYRDHVITWVRLMNGLFTEVARHLGLPTAVDLVKYMREHQLYPSTRNILEEEDTHHMSLFDQVNGYPVQVYGYHISPPNCLASLTHWRAVTNLLAKLSVAQQVAIKDYAAPPVPQGPPSP